MGEGAPKGRMRGNIKNHRIAISLNFVLASSMNKRLRNLQKSLRHHSNDAEKRIWWQLRGRRFSHVKFRRQQIIAGYIVDFICFEKNLIIEIDGSQHSEQTEYDRERTEKLTREGFKVLRFWNNEIFNQMDSVLERIYRELGGD